MKHLYTLFVPGGIILLAALAILRPRAVPGAVVPVVQVFPYIIAAGGLFLGWFFNRSRIVYTILILAAADMALQHFAFGAGAMRGSNRIVFQAVAFLLPLNLVAYALITERGIFTLRGISRLLPLFAQGGAVWFACQPQGRPWVRWLGEEFISRDLVSWTSLPQPVLAAFAVALLVQAVQFWRFRNAMDGGMLWALGAVFVALSWTRPSWLSTSYLATAGLMQVVALLEMSYRMAYHDELTGLPGRRALNEDLLQLGGRYAVAMVDVDHFKKFNDQYGHHVGDQVLKMVAAKLGEVGGGGKAYRYGGEEFAVLFPGRSLDDAKPYLEVVRKTIEATPFALRGRLRPRKKPTKAKGTGKPKKEVSVTVSIGVADRDERNRNSAEVIKAADKALYKAKESGRNQVKP